MNWGRLFGFDKPNVKNLAKDGDIDGLIEAYLRWKRAASSN